MSEPVDHYALALARTIVGLQTIRNIGMGHDINRSLDSTIRRYDKILENHLRVRALEIAAHGK